jgi:hypothetical protein
MCPKKNQILSDAQRTSSFRVRDQARSSRLSRAVYTVWCNHLPLFKLARVLVRFDYVVRFIVNANYSIV